MFCAHGLRRGARLSPQPRSRGLTRPRAVPHPPEPETPWRQTKLRHVVDSKEFQRECLELVFEVAEEMEKVTPGSPASKQLEGYCMATLFYEPSTRTRLSFEAAMGKLGGVTLSTESAGQFSSAAKGETLEGAPHVCLGRSSGAASPPPPPHPALRCCRAMRWHARATPLAHTACARCGPWLRRRADTVRTIEGYADCLVLRHYESGSCYQATKVANKPVISAGDGPGQHPTQVRRHCRRHQSRVRALPGPATPAHAVQRGHSTIPAMQALLDVYTIRRELGRLDGFKIAMIGDLANGRTVHSLAYLLSKFQDVEMLFCSPENIRMKPDLKQYLTDVGVTWREEDSLDAVAAEADVLYQTRIQKERFLVRCPPPPRTVFVCALALHSVLMRQICAPKIRQRRECLEG